MAYDYRVISSDSHIDLRWIDPDLFVNNAPAKLKDEVPRVVETKDGPIWFAEGRAMTAVPLNLPISTVFSPDLDAIPPKGVSKHIDRMHEVGFYDGQPHPTTLDLRLADMDLGGVDAEIIYGPLSAERQLKSLIHRRTACRRPAEETKGCVSEFGILVLKRKTWSHKRSTR